MKKNDAMILTLTIKALVFSLSICCKHTLIHHLLKNVIIFLCIKTVYAAISYPLCEASFLLVLSFDDGTTSYFPTIRQ